MKFLRSLSDWLNDYLKPVHLVVFLLIFVIFIGYVLPSVSAATKVATGSDRAPDTSFFYRAADIYEIAEEYGLEGRRYYIRSRFTFDVVWPLVYGAFLVAAISRLVHKRRRGDKVRFLNLLPLAGVLFDYLENIATASAMYVFPDTIFLAYFAPYFTLVKWLCIYSAFIIIGIGFMVVAWNRFINFFRS